MIQDLFGFFYLFFRKKFKKPDEKPKVREKERKNMAQQRKNPSKKFFAIKIPKMNSMKNKITVETINADKKTEKKENNRHTVTHPASKISSASFQNV